MSTKATLGIKLFAGEVLVAESEDSALWQEVLARITGAPVATATPAAPATPLTGSAVPTHTPAMPRGGTPIAKLAAALGVSEADVDSALSPTEEEPFIRIEPRHWSTFIRNVPERGAGAVPALVVSATAAALWFKAMGRDEVPFDVAKDVLGALGAGYKNPTRSINNCAWLQLRGDNLRLDPRNFPQGEAFLRSFIQGERPAA